MKRLAKLLPALAFFGGLAVLHADTAAPAQPPAPSIAEMQARSSALMERIAEDQRYVMFLKEQAKKAKDVIKLNCVNDKLVQLKAQQNIADTTNVQLQASLAKSGDDAASLYVQLNQTATDIQRLREETNACIGTPELFKQEAGVVVEHPEIPDDPLADPPFDVDVEPPAYASPFR
jgi:hypothetical protein